jgi:hypothetical protein
VCGSLVGHGRPTVLMLPRKRRHQATRPIQSASLMCRSGRRTAPDLLRVSDDDCVTELRVRPVDPRDTEWEVRHPRFRVYFWSRRSLGQGWMSREFELSGGDVVAALAWAAEHAVGQETYAVHCVVEGAADGTGLVRLAGEDPTRT